MKRLAALAALVLVLSGCPMTNDQIIENHKKCQAAGMKSFLMNNGRLSCEP